MEILVRMKMISLDENNSLNIYLEEGDDQITAEVEDVVFTKDDLYGAKYIEQIYSVEDVSCHVVEMTLGEEKITINSTLEEFEEVLSELGLVQEDEESEVYNITSFNEIHENSEEAA